MPERPCADMVGVSGFRSGTAARSHRLRGLVCGKQHTLLSSGVRFGPLRGETSLDSVRLRGMTNDPRVLACALSGYRCIVLLHAFKELRPRAYRRELPLARSRRDLVVADPVAWVDTAF